MKYPIVSVVMPAFNSEKTIYAAIDSVLTQTYDSIELIICNDASTDETGNILLSIKDPRVRIFSNSSNLGEGLSRNLAIQQANGKWLAFIDADDAWKSDRLKKLMETVGKKGECFIFDDILECHDTSNGLIPWRTVRGKNAFGNVTGSEVKVPIEELISSNRSLIKPIFPIRYVREHRITHSDRKYGADLEFFLRVLSFSKLSIWYIPEPLYLYRITPNSASTNKYRFKLLKEVLDKGIELFPDSLIVRNAFQKKIAHIDRDEKYVSFFWAIKAWQFKESIRIAHKYPWVINEFLTRSIRALVYHIHRIRHGGRVR